MATAFTVHCAEVPPSPPGPFRGRPQKKRNAFGACCQFYCQSRAQCCVDWFAQKMKALHVAALSIHKLFLLGQGLGRHPVGTTWGFLRRLAFHGGPVGGIVNHFNFMIGFFSFRDSFYKHPGQDRKVGISKRKMYYILF